jgi:hypothetical protein
MQIRARKDQSAARKLPHPGLYTVHLEPGQGLLSAIECHRRRTGWRGGLVVTGQRGR